MGILSNTKDRIVEQAALTYLNSTLLPPYGRATSLKINSAAKSIAIEAELKGETAPLQVEIIEYELTQDGERYFVTIKDIRTSREWLTALAENQLCNHRFELPAKAGRLLVHAL